MRPSHLRPVPPKILGEIASEWDELAADRLDHTRTGIDISFEHVLIPGLLGLLYGHSGRALDIGCGVGTFTRILSKENSPVFGIDPSGRSIDIARHSNSGRGVTYVKASVEEFAASGCGTFDVVVANMTLMDVPDLLSSMQAIAALLSPNGLFVFSITHPWFWPVYWEYSDLTWFDYNKEMFIEAQFVISQASTSHVSTHIHRPLGSYFGSFSQCGFAVSRLIEPMPSPAVEALYPSPWRFPRFLFGSLRQSGRSHD